MVTEIVIIVNTGGRVAKDTMKKAVKIVGEAFEDLEERPPSEDYLQMRAQTRRI